MFLNSATKKLVVRQSFLFACLVFEMGSPGPACAAEQAERPNILLVMADDQGWGETGYNGHPILRTPHLDAMAASGLRFDRFYAGAPVCSPTRAAVLTGRASYRTGVPEHGYALHREEITLAALLSSAGYQTAHMGKWHLNGIRGPGVPILASDDFHPGVFGFDHWLSVTNFYDRDPLLSRMGKFEDNRGDSSDVIVEQALKHIEQQANSKAPFFTVIWFGTPHSPFKASDEDNAAFRELDEQSMHHYGELVALDRSIGTLRAGLRRMGIENNTLFWYCSDNGGLPKIKPPTTGGLRGNKGLIFEGGLRVPGIIEWPGTVIPRRTDHPACVMDILPTILELAEVEYPAPERPRDGISLVHLFKEETDSKRQSPIAFRYRNMAALVDDDWKILSQNYRKQEFELYCLSQDADESEDIADSHPQRLERMKQQLIDWYTSVDESIAGKDYPKGRLDPNHPKPRFWSDDPRYKPFLADWTKRWEYKSWFEKRSKKKQ